MFQGRGKYFQYSECTKIATKLKQMKPWKIEQEANNVHWVWTKKSLAQLSQGVQLYRTINLIYRTMNLYTFQPLC